MRSYRPAQPPPPSLPHLLFTAPIPLLLVCVLVATAPNPGHLAAPGPSRPGIDIESYRFELTLRDDTDEIAGRATIAVRFTADGVTELPLDLIGVRDDGRGMRVTGVSMAGGGDRAHVQRKLGDGGTPGEGSSRARLGCRERVAPRPR